MDQRPTHFILEGNPTGTQYGALIDFCSKRSTKVSLIQPSVGTDESARILNQLEPYLTESALVQEWPGTRTRGLPRRILTYQVNEKSASIIKNSVTNLFEWCSPPMPEDVAFYRQDGSVLLATVGHESIGHLFITDEEMLELNKANPKVQLTIGTRPVPGVAQSGELR
jgi:hypothetical protein